MHMLMNRANATSKLHVSDIMRQGAIRVRPDATARQGAAVLAYYGLTSAPVVERTGRLVGVVSVNDILHLRTREMEAGAEGPDPMDQAASASLLDDYRVSEIMLPVLFSIEPTASLAELAELLDRTGTDRVPVVGNGLLLGMVGSVDLLQTLAAPASA
jgi:CBS domain-containing protein